LGMVRLVKLTPRDIERLMLKKLDSGLSPRSVNYIRTVLRIALNRAIRWGYVERNVATLVDPMKQPKRNIEVWTPREVRRFIQAVKGDRLETLYIFSLSLGLRLGEVRGLRWQDIELENGTLTVNGALQRIDGKLKLKETKTPQSNRTIELPNICFESLNHHRIRQLEEQLIAGSNWNNEFDLVFTSPRGTPLDSSNVRKRFKKIVAFSELPQLRLHDLRHCCASLLVAQDVPVRVIMEILGHTQIATTMDLYAHIMPTAKRDAADRLDEILNAQT